MTEAKLDKIYDLLQKNADQIANFGQRITALEHGLRHEERPSTEYVAPAERVTAPDTKEPEESSVGSKSTTDLSTGQQLPFPQGRESRPADDVKAAHAGSHKSPGVYEPGPTGKRFPPQPVSMGPAYPKGPVMQNASQLKQFCTEKMKMVDGWIENFPEQATVQAAAKAVKARLHAAKIAAEAVLEGKQPPDEALASEHTRLTAAMKALSFLIAAEPVEEYGREAMGA